MKTPKTKESTFTWPDGREYVGQYKDDKKEGKGKFTFANGIEYNGDWKDGKQHGKGTLTSFNADGTVKEKIEGEWSKGLKVKK